MSQGPYNPNEGQYRTSYDPANYPGGVHPPYCTCVDCVNRSLELRNRRQSAFRALTRLGAGISGGDKGPNSSFRKSSFKVWFPIGLLFLIISLAAGGYFLFRYNESTQEITWQYENFERVSPTQSPTSTPNPNSVSTSTPVPTPVPTPIPTPTLTPIQEFALLEKQFNQWKASSIQELGSLPYVLEGKYDSVATVNLPVCGIVDVNTLFELETPEYILLGNQEIVLSGEHKLLGQAKKPGIVIKVPLLELSLPTLDSFGSSNTGYIAELRQFLDKCVDKSSMQNTIGSNFSKSPTNVETPVPNPTPKPVKGLKVTDVWGREYIFGLDVTWELAVDKNTPIGTTCDLEMWAGTKKYESKSHIVSESDFEEGNPLTVVFSPENPEKIRVGVARGETLKDIVDLKINCLAPTPIPPPTSTPTLAPPTPTPFPTSTPLPTPTPLPMLRWGSGSGYPFISPRGVATGPDESVYVVDRDAHMVVKFTSEGTFLANWGSEGSGPGQFNSPHGVAVAPDGSVYVADTQNCRIQKFTSDGNFIWERGSRGTGAKDTDRHKHFLHPHGVAVGPNGSVYVADTDNNRIHTYTPDGTFIDFLVEGYEVQFRSPFGLSVGPDGSVYVADHDNHRVQRSTSDGRFIVQWGSEGGNSGQFRGPFGVAISDDGKVYIADKDNHRVQIFTSDGRFIGKWGSEGGNPGQFKNPFGLAVGSNGNVYVTDTTYGRVQKFAGGP